MRAASPSVSVVIPSYNQAEFLDEAIGSVLAQSFTDFEILVINDASTDSTDEVVKRYSDPRIVYVTHAENKGLAAARNTGIRSGKGDVIALLDADDYFHPEKLARHICFLSNHPEVGVTYNAHFELNHSASTIRELVRPPLTTSLADLVMGFPFAPSDMVIRRDWLGKIGLFDESLIHFSEDLDINCRLALAGCQFASVDRALNYRRHHSGRNLRVGPRLDAALGVLEKIFSSPACSDEVRSLRTKAFATNYAVWAFYALAQSELDLGKHYLGRLAELDPEFIAGTRSPYLRFLVSNCVADQNLNHPDLLRRLLDAHPPEFRHLQADYDWAAGLGHLIWGVRSAIWDRMDCARFHFSMARRENEMVDEPFLGVVAHQLISFAVEFGEEELSKALKRLSPLLQDTSNASVTRKLLSTVSFNWAFICLEKGFRRAVPRALLRAVRNDPSFIKNRGTWSVLRRSMFSLQS